MKFQFKAKNNKGEVVEGVREETDRFKVSHNLIEEGLVPISVEQESAKAKLDFSYFNELVVRIKLQDKINFAKNLSSMIGAGLSLSRALSVLHKQTTNTKLKRVIKTVLEDVEAGKSLSQALAKFPNVFSQVFIAMVSAGEESGSLPDSLKIVAEQLDKIYALRKKVVSALIYPVVVLVIMIIIGILMLVYVVPNITASFKEFGAQLPLSTTIIITGSDFLIAHLFLVIFLIALCIGTVYYALGTEKGQRVADYILLKIPVASLIIKEVNSATTARTLSSLISSGVPIVKAMEITRDVLQNSYYKEIMARAETAIQKGEALSSVIQSEPKLYPILLGEMIEVGEETGNLPQMLMNVALFYEEEVNTKTKDMSTIIEPALMLVMGIAVGFFAISIIQPIYSLSSSV